MKRRFSYFISFIFHPVVLALIVPFLIVYKQYENIFYAFKWTFFSAIFLLLILFVGFLIWHRDFFEDFDISRRRRRVVFYGVVCLAAIVYFSIAASFKSIFFSLSIVAAGIIIGIVLLEILTLFVKASIHTAVGSAFVLSATIMFGPGGLLSSFWILPLIVWSRLYLKKHTGFEILCGGAYGTFVTLLTFAIAKAM